MGNKLYVGNLAYSVRDQDLNDAFSQYGAVSSAKVMMDRETGRSKGFGFVEMSTSEEAAMAVANLNGKMMGDRTIRVEESRPSTGPRRGGGGGRGGGGSRFGGGGGSRRW